VVEHIKGALFEFGGKLVRSNELRGRARQGASLGDMGNGSQVLVLQAW
jgi:hypothetical protein